jgi:putative flippase GtrA
MDADFSHDPTNLPALLQSVEHEGADIAVGSRYVNGGVIVGWTRDRHLLSSVANRLARLILSLKPADVTAGYKCYRRAFLESLPLSKIISPGYAFQVEMLMRGERGGWRIIEVPITFRDRTVGRSKVSRHELVSSTISLITLAMSRRGLREMGKFSLVGALNFSIDIGITNLGVLVFSLAETWAGYLGILFALANSFYFNRRWTFRVRSGKLVDQAFRFLLVNGLGAAINASLYTLFLVEFDLDYNFAKLLAIGGSVAWNFLGTKYWVFGRQKSR